MRDVGGRTREEPRRGPAAHAGHLFKSRWFWPPGGLQCGVCGGEWAMICTAGSDAGAPELLLETQPHLEVSPSSSGKLKGELTSARLHQ